MRSIVKTGRGIVNPLFSAQRVEDMNTAKHLKNLGIIVPAKAVRPTVNPDEALRSSLIQQGILKPATDPTDEEIEQHYLDIERGDETTLADIYLAEAAVSSN